MILGCFRIDFELILEWIWNDFWMILEWFLNNFGIIFERFLVYLEIILKLFSDDVGMILECLWMILGWFWGDFCMISGRFWFQFLGLVEHKCQFLILVGISDRKREHKWNATRSRRTVSKFDNFPHPNYLDTATWRCNNGWGRPSCLGGPSSF